MMRLFKRSLIRNSLYMLPLVAWMCGQAIGQAYLTTIGK